MKERIRFPSSPQEYIPLDPFRIDSHNKTPGNSKWSLKTSFDLSKPVLILLVGQFHVFVAYFYRTLCQQFKGNSMLVLAPAETLKFAGMFLNLWKQSFTSCNHLLVRSTGEDLHSWFSGKLGSTCWRVAEPSPRRWWRPASLRSWWTSAGPRAESWAPLVVPEFLRTPLHPWTHS